MYFTEIHGNNFTILSRERKAANWKWRKYACKDCEVSFLFFIFVAFYLFILCGEVRGLAGSSSSFYSRGPRSELKTSSGWVGSPATRWAILLAHVKSFLIGCQLHVSMHGIKCWALDGNRSQKRTGEQCFRHPGAVPVVRYLFILLQLGPGVPQMLVC